MRAARSRLPLVPTSSLAGEASRAATSSNPKGGAAKAQAAEAKEQAEANVEEPNVEQLAPASESAEKASGRKRSPSRSATKTATK